MVKKLKTIFSPFQGTNYEPVTYSDSRALEPAGLFLLTIAFATRAAGSLSPGFEFFLYVIFILWFLVKRQTPFLGMLLATVTMLVFCKLVPAGSSRWVGLWHTVLCLATAEFGSIFHRRIMKQNTSTIANSLNLFIFIAGVILLLDVAVFGNPVVRPIIDDLYRPISSFLTGLWGETALPLGTTYWSLPVLVTYLLIAVFQPNWQRRLFMLAGLVGAVVIYFAMLTPLQTYALSLKSAGSLTGWYERNHGPFQRLSEPISWQYIAQLLSVERPQIILTSILVTVYAVACCICGIPTKKTVITAERHMLTSTGFVLSSCLGLTIGCVFCWITLPRVISQSDLVDRKVAIMTSNVDMTVPVHGSYGHRSIGMFGRLPMALRSLGLLVDEIEGVKQLHTDHEILIFANLQENFTEREKQKIWSWVKNGGGLLVLTDHTGDKGLRLPTNDLLRPFRLEVNFDTAKLFSVDGGYDYEMLLGSPLRAIRGVHWRGAHRYGTGGSIQTSRPAMPIMQARYAFSELGSFTAVKRGNLGNLKYDIGEKLGDVPLAGISHLGKGRAILFGDTSPFQNGAFVSSHEFIRQVLGMLLPSGPKPEIRCLVSLVLGAIAIGFWVLTVLKRNGLELVIFAFIMVFVWSILWSLKYEMPKAVEIKNSKTAIIDISTCPYAGLQDWTATDLTGLSSCLMREGYTPIISEGPLERQLEKSNQDDVLFLVSPLWKLSQTDEKAIESFLKKGGTLILNCGFEEATNVNVILKQYGVKILDVPLGSTPGDEASDPHHLHFYNAWQVNGEGQVLVNLKGRPVVLAKQVGQGKLVVIGDSKFFWNANLESRQSHRPGNIAFLGQILNL